MNTRLFRLLRAVPLGAALAVVCLAVVRPAQAAGAIRVSVSPNVLLADGVSSATVTAEVRNSSGRPVRDGTEVRFYTTAGTITQVAFTSAGVARATLTSSSVPQAANVSVSFGVDQSVITVPMVSKLVEASVGGRVLRVTGQYVAYSEDKRFIQADQQVRVRYRGVEVEANSVQIDVGANTLKALGKVQIASDEKTKVGERLWLDLRSFEGYILAVGTRQWFSAYGLTDLPERPKNLNPDFELVDLSDSKLLWVSKQANYVVDERVQVQGARAFVAGIKSIRLPYHQVNLQGGFNQTEQYVGIGTEGVSLDIPLYLRMTPGSSTALRIGYGSREGGLGYFTRNNGLSVDLVQKYGFNGSSEGEAQLVNMSSLSDWGFQWNHTQQLTKSTRLVANLQFPRHRDIYMQTSLTQGLPIGTLHADISGTKLHNSPLAKSMTFAFESKPKPMADGNLNVSVASSFHYRDTQEVRVPHAGRFGLTSSQVETVGLKVRPRSLQLLKGLTLDSSATLQAYTGTQTGFGPALETHLTKTLPHNGSLTVGVTYNQLAGVTGLVPTQGALNANLMATYPVGKKLRITALGNMALDAESSNSIIQASYQLTPSWRLDFLHSLYQFGKLGSFDYQFGIARALGGRELSLYWSHKQHKLLVEFGATRF